MNIVAVVFFSCVTFRPDISYNHHGWLGVKNQLSIYLSLCNIIYVSALGSAEGGRAKFPLLLLLRA